MSAQDFARRSHESLLDTRRLAFVRPPGSVPERTELENAQRAVLNILEDFVMEKIQLKAAQSSALNILDDFSAEKANLRETQRAVLNILEDFNAVKVKVELANQQLGDEIKMRERIEGDLHRTNRELIGANKELEAFSYSVSHDLRAPLRQVHGFAKILFEECASQLDDSAQHYLHRVVDGAQQMGRLVDDLLDLSRLGRQNLNRRSIDLNAIIQGVREELRLEVGGRAIEWRIMSLPIVECDPGLLKLVFTNLLSNAVKFTRPRAQAVIEVGVESVNGLIAIYVRDNGVGFDPQYAEKLFGVFQRLHRQEDFEGTGIGLATVQRIVHKHRGRIWAEGRPDCGATFYFTLGSFGERVAEPTDKKGEQSWLPQAK